MCDVIEILRSRGLLEAVTSEEVSVRLQKEQMTVYAGFDPTSESLQIGNLATIMVLSHFQRCGHRIIALVGGATGLIGDPSGKTSERALLSIEEIKKNTEGIKENLSRFLDFNAKKAPAILVNNYDWLSHFTFIDFLREVGVHFRVGAMLAKESVRARLESETGMSFCEFSYQILQAYDFLHLYDSYGCSIQVGGSDQWGNITAGIDLIRKLRGKEVFGITLPLICDSAGRKFGKSEGNAVYLDASKTSYYDFYQFFMRVEDADVGHLLRVYTFLPMEEINCLEEETRRNPELRLAQKRLAREMTRMVHGESALATAEKASEVLFGADMGGLCADELMQIFADVPSVTLPRAKVYGMKVYEVAAMAGVCSSRGEARRLIQNNGLYLNNKKVSGIEVTITDQDILDGKLIVFRTGKRNFFLLKVTS